MSRALDFRRSPNEDAHRPRTVLQRIGSATWLLVVWLVVRGSFTLASFVGGLIAISAVMLLFRQGTPVSSARHRFNPYWTLRYLGHFGYELIRANIEVALAVINPSRIEHRRAIIEVPLPSSSRLVGAILANAVSLTPGTSIIEVSQEPPAFHVHVLNMAHADVTRSSIAELHWRLVRAIGPVDAVERVEADAADLRERARVAAAEQHDGDPLVQRLSEDHSRAEKRKGRDLG